MIGHTLSMLARQTLRKLYVERKLSMAQVADALGCSIHKVEYWLKCYGVERRSRSDAGYIRKNPHGDPFKPKAIDTKESAYLYGLGLGLYWGEGTKANLHSVRLGNSDPRLIATFIEFLEQLFGVQRSDLRFGLQIFTDIPVEEALNYWSKTLLVQTIQFYKPHVTRSIRKGTYTYKSRYGVVTVYYNNKKLRDIIVNALPR